MAKLLGICFLLAVSILVVFAMAEVDPAAKPIEPDNLKVGGGLLMSPIIASSAPGLRQQENVMVACITEENSDKLWNSLVKGAADVLVVDAPSGKIQLPENQSLALIPIGYATAVIIVHKDNSVKALTISQLQKIYDGTSVNWQELSQQNFSIIPVASKSSLARETINALILRDHPMGKNVEIYDLSINAYGRLKYTPGAIGFCGPYLPDGKSARIVPIEGILPTEENVIAGKYPLVTEIYAVIKSQRLSEKKIRIFLRFWQTKGGRMCLQDNGYVPLCGCPQTEHLSESHHETQRTPLKKKE
jgi:phosphate transport system substrate-binding protein